MSFLHTHSCEAVKSELDLFTVYPTQTSIESSQFIEYKPVTSLTDTSPIEFSIPGHGDEYVDLTRTMIHVKVQIVKGDGSNLPDGALVGPVNNFLHSLFSQVDVYFNQRPVSASSGGYAYRAFFETLLNYSQDAKDSHLTCALWYNDTAGKMDTAMTTTTCPNKGLDKRKSFTEKSKVVDMIGHLHSDVFNQQKCLMNGVEMRVRLVKSKDSFCLMDYGNLNAKIHLIEANLRVFRVKISPNILIAHHKALSRGTAKYPLTRTEIKSFTLHTGVTGETLDNVIMGQLPKRIILGFVSNKAYNGDFKLNPFNFAHHNLTHLCLYVDGQQIPSKAIQPDYANGNFIDAYHTTFSGTGINFGNEGHCISREEYALGYCLYCFDLTSDRTAHCTGHWNLIRQGTVRIDVRFSDALENSLNCVIYTEYDNVLEIDSSRNIIIDYSV